MTEARQKLQLIQSHIAATAFLTDLERLDPLEITLVVLSNKNYPSIISIMYDNTVYAFHMPHIDLSAKREPTNNVVPTRLWAFLNNDRIVKNCYHSNLIISKLSKVGIRLTIKLTDLCDEVHRVGLFNGYPGQTRFSIKSLAEKVLGEKFEYTDICIPTANNFVNWDKEVFTRRELEYIFETSRVISKSFVVLETWPDAPASDNEKSNNSAIYVSPEKLKSFPVITISEGSKRKFTTMEESEHLLIDQYESYLCKNNCEDRPCKKLASKICSSSGFVY